MSKKSGRLIKLVTTATLGSLLFATASFGDEAYSANEGLDQWAKTTSALVNKKMARLGTSLRNEAEGIAHMRVTINTAGEVLSSSMVHSSGFSNIDNAAKVTLVRVGEFPEIPASYNASSLTFGVRLIYANSKQSLANFNKGLATRVRSEEILASAAGVEVLSLGK